MKLIILILCVLCSALATNASPISDEENISDVSTSPKNEEDSTEINIIKKENEEDKMLEGVTSKPKLRNKVEKEQSITKTKIKDHTILLKPPIREAETPHSQISNMQIKTFGPNDIEYSFQTANQRQAKTIHVEENPDDENKPFVLSDKGSFSSFNAEHDYVSKVEYTAGNEGYRPKVSFSFHS